MADVRQQTITRLLTPGMITGFVRRMPPDPITLAQNTEHEDDRAFVVQTAHVNGDISFPLFMETNAHRHWFHG